MNDFAANPEEELGICRCCNKPVLVRDCIQKVLLLDRQLNRVLKSQHLPVHKICWEDLKKTQRKRLPFLVRFLFRTGFKRQGLLFGIWWIKAKIRWVKLKRKFRYRGI
ncbi:MAG: hypothetical protein WC824_09780 [Bacteroidota bacterium]